MIAAWPESHRLFALCSAEPCSQWNRWTILARPTHIVRHVASKTTIETLTSTDRSGSDEFCCPVLRWNERITHDPLVDLRRIVFAEELAEHQDRRSNSGEPPFRGGWIGVLSYDLGALIEPCAVAKGTEPADAKQPANDPVFEFAWCPDALVFDGLNGTWHEIGEPPVDLDNVVHLVSSSDCSGLHRVERPTAAFELSEFCPEQTRSDVERSVKRIIEHIRAGDIFQANVSQRFHADFSGSTRALFRSAHLHQSSWYQAYLELDHNRAILSLSPELFLAYEPATREVITRPIKGTAPAEGDPRQLAVSEKDAAELNMITDLMRNDIGRVCVAGSVRVDDARSIETHRAVHHGVSTIRGRLRDDRTLMDLMLATMPGGSITGAPKIRAMQIIDELEPFRRGVFFGSIGYVSLSGHACFNLAIRTMRIEGSRATYVAGAGIVSDSIPGLEYNEMLLKASAARELSSIMARDVSPTTNEAERHG